MSTMMTIRAGLTALLVTMAAGSFTRALGQTPVGYGEEPSLTEAIQGKAELFVPPNMLFDAAKRLRLEVAERDERDPAGIQALAVRGRLLFAVGKMDEALETMVEAGERALLVGDVVTAAHNLLDAAYICFLQGRDVQGKSLVDVAEGLSTSPLLDDLQRRGIRIRIENTLMT